MSLKSHKNFLRYYSCWLEPSQPSSEIIELALIKAQCPEHDSCDSCLLDSLRNLSVESQFIEEEIEDLAQLIRKGQSFLTLKLMIQMEYCEGMTLKKYLSLPERKVSRKESLIIFRQVMRGIQ